jgi:hypothetical protein
MGCLVCCPALFDHQDRAELARRKKQEFRAPVRRDREQTAAALRQALAKHADLLVGAKAGSRRDSLDSAASGADKNPKAHDATGRRGSGGGKAAVAASRSANGLPSSASRESRKDAQPQPQPPQQPRGRDDSDEKGGLPERLPTLRVSRRTAPVAVQMSAILCFSFEEAVLVVANATGKAEGAEKKRLFLQRNHRQPRRQEIEEMVTSEIQSFAMGRSELHMALVRLTASKEGDVRALSERALDTVVKRLLVKFKVEFPLHELVNGFAAACPLDEAASNTASLENVFRQLVTEDMDIFFDTLLLAHDLVAAAIRRRVDPRGSSETRVPVERFLAEFSCLHHIECPLAPLNYLEEWIGR